jgi:hypothetical protein
VSIVEGAQFNGNIVMEAPKAAASSPKPAAATAQTAPDAAVRASKAANAT